MSRPEPSLVELEPFGLEVCFPEGTSFGEVDVDQLKAWVDVHRLVVLRGLDEVPAWALPALAQRLGPLQPWPFGAVHEIRIKESPKNYLYTDREVPLHWDGAFAEEVPHWLVFVCPEAPAPDAGGQTTFVDTVDPDLPPSWSNARFRYETEKLAHYGGRFDADLVDTHPTLGKRVLRFAEPVQDLNPVHVEGVGEGDDALIEEIATHLHRPERMLAHDWRAGDVVIADNHALLHGRRAFTRPAARTLLRVNVLDPDRSWWGLVQASWRLRRPEFFRAEAAILVAPLLLAAEDPGALLSLAVVEGIILFWLLFQIGDLVNCLEDAEVDLYRKTHLAEAVRRLGRRGVWAQIVVSAVLAVGIGLHLAWMLDRWWLGAAAVAGIALGASYTAPPLKLKSRGLWQILAYVVLLFIGPMALVEGLLQPWPSLELLAISLCFGAMQTGVLLVNNAEDLDEDERLGIRTASVVLGARGSVRMASALVGLGGVGLVLALLWLGRAAPWTWLGAAASVVPVVLSLRWTLGISREIRGLGSEQARRAIREHGSEVPGRVEFAAYVLMAASALIALGRWS